MTDEEIQLEIQRLQELIKSRQEQNKIDEQIGKQQKKKQTDFEM